MLPKRPDHLYTVVHTAPTNNDNKLRVTNNPVKGKSLQEAQLFQRQHRGNTNIRIYPHFPDREPKPGQVINAEDTV